MSAAQRMGRICPECHKEIEGRAPGTIRHPLCQMLRKRELRRALKERRAAMGILEPKRPPKPEYKSVAPRQTYVRNVVDATPPRAPNVLCKGCFGEPWARLVSRLDENRNPIGAVGPDGVSRCRTCLEPYAPEPKPEQMCLLGSSAGTAAQHGRLHGMNGACSGRPSRKNFS